MKVCGRKIIGYPVHKLIKILAFCSLCTLECIDFYIFAKMENDYPAMASSIKFKTNL
jgi:hypothetical protein